MKVLAVILEVLSALAAGAALAAGVWWAKQDHRDTALLEQRRTELKGEIATLRAKEKNAFDWIQNPPTNAVKETEAKRNELYAARGELAGKLAALAALEDDAKGVPVAASWEAFARAKWAGRLGMAAIVFGAAAGIAGLLTGEG